MRRDSFSVKTAFTLLNSRKQHQMHFSSVSLQQRTTNSEHDACSSQMFSVIYDLVSVFVVILQQVRISDSSRRWN